MNSLAAVYNCGELNWHTLSGIETCQHKSIQIHCLTKLDWITQQSPWPIKKWVLERIIQYKSNPAIVVPRRRFRRLRRRSRDRGNRGRNSHHADTKFSAIQAVHSIVDLLHKATIRYRIATRDMHLCKPNLYWNIHE